MKKAQLLAKIEKSWKEFNASYDGLSDDQMTAPGVTEGWSVKDILAHVSTWEEECLKYVPVILAGERQARYSATYGGVDAFNALMTEKKQGLSLSEIRRQLEETHRKLVDAVKAIPEEHFVSENSLRRRLRLDTYTHYPVHAEAIREWRGRSA